MTVEQRVRYLLKAALRAERNGEHRVARSLRRMADDILPVGAPETAPSSETARG
jgi:hypothetical protein